MQFLSIDVETSNPSTTSICQIGIARFIDGKITEQWSSLIDPEDYFDDFNTSLHGIDKKMVAGKPKLPEISHEIRTLLESGITVCHTHFDRIAITRAFSGYGLSPIATRWLDTARVARRTWEDVARSGYGLSPLCKKIGYEFKHHDALEDAKAAGEVLLAAIRESKIDLDSWMIRVGHPIRANGATIPRPGNPEGSLFGEVIVFTGTLELERLDAATLAASAGIKVGGSITKKTTILVLGDHDLSKLAGHQKSSKQRKAEQLIEEGKPIRIIYESDFIALVGSAQGATSDKAVRAVS